MKKTIVTLKFSFIGDQTMYSGFLLMANTEEYFVNLWNFDNKKYLYQPSMLRGFIGISTCTKRQYQKEHSCRIKFRSQVLFEF